MREYLSPRAASLLSLILNAETSAVPDDYVRGALKDLGPRQGKMVVDALLKSSKGSKKKRADSLKKWADKKLPAQE